MKSHITTRILLTLYVCQAVCLLSAEKAFCSGEKASFTGHVFYGRMVISNDGSNYDDEDIDIFIFGVDAQKSFGGGTFKYGIETGALFSLDSSVRYFGASSGGDGGNVAVSVDVSSIMIDYFAGGFLSFEPAWWLRLSVGTGPLLIWSLWESEPIASSDEEVIPQSESGLGVGVYTRVGIDLFFTKNVGINAGARFNQTTLSLGSTSGDLDIEGWQFYCGLALHF